MLDVAQDEASGSPEPIRDGELTAYVGDDIFDEIGIPTSKAGAIKRAFDCSRFNLRCKQRCSEFVVEAPPQNTHLIVAQSKVAGLDQIGDRAHLQARVFFSREIGKNREQFDHRANGRNCVEPYSFFQRARN